MNEVEMAVYGRVQGIRFRKRVKSFCDKIGITGFVENRKDGSVYLIAQGKEQDLDSLFLWVQKGPFLSNIEEVKSHWRKPSVDFDEFSIRKEKNYFPDKMSALKNLGKRFFGARERVPIHIAIIPDGNRRWARKNGLAETLGHSKAIAKENVMSLLNESMDLGIKYVSLWGFSCDNWKRSKPEIDSLFSLFESMINWLREEAHARKIRLIHYGRKDRIPKSLSDMINKVEDETKGYDKLTVILCIDYSGRDEIIRAVNEIVKDGVKKVDSRTFERYLDSANVPDPDLIIRTSGEVRTSGFMSYQSAYAEWYFTNTMFPDFNAEELRKAVREYSERNRRFGGN